MADIYDQHRATFSRVSAFVILSDHHAFPKDPQAYATVALKFPANGASRLYAYVHVLGKPMVRGSATGFGYDKRSAAVASSVHKMSWDTATETIDDAGETYAAFIRALRDDDGRDWTRRLQDAGFIVLQAV